MSRGRREARKEGRGREAGKEACRSVGSREQEERECAPPQKEQTWRLQQEDMEQLPSSKLLQIIHPCCSRIGRPLWSSDEVGRGRGAGGGESGAGGGQAGRNRALQGRMGRSSIEGAGQGGPGSENPTDRKSVV